MPKKVVSYEFIEGTNPYISDFNENYTVSKRFNAPPDFDQATIDAVLAAVGASERTEPAVCSDNGFGDLRYLEFTRLSGNTFSLALPNKNNLLTAAAAVKAIVDPLNSGNNPVACIALVGEYFSNLNDLFGVSYDGTTFATSHKAPATALKQNFASGVISYEADAATTVGLAVTHSIRSITEKADNEFAAQLGTTPAGCIGDFLTVLNCGNGRRNPRAHRRAELAFATKADPTDTAEVAQSETIELPIAGSGALDILACLNSAAALDAVYCLGYRGESYKRVDRLL